RENLAGHVAGEGETNVQQVVGHHEQRFEGGFLTWGATAVHSRGMIAEGMPDEQVAVQRIVFAALPDETTVLGMQFARTARRRVYLRAVKGLHLHVPNDLFNGGRRIYHTARGPIDLAGAGSEEERLDLGGAWVNIDDCLSVVGVYGMDSLWVHRPGRRQIGLRGHDATDPNGPGGMLYCDEICSPLWVGMASVDPGTVLFDVGFVLQASTDHHAAACVRDARCRRMETASAPAVRAMAADGTDGKTYLLLANFGEDRAAVDLDVGSARQATDPVTEEHVAADGGVLNVAIEAEGARLLIVE
ncbi:MAG TPA: hypothetical protein VMZ50_03185, partial [Phycisphaerae bacterium]|nr:hypothetical protein [Phycisphaerae bacterium]